MLCYGEKSIIMRIIKVKQSSGDPAQCLNCNSCSGRPRVNFSQRTTHVASLSVRPCALKILLFISSKKKKVWCSLEGPPLRRC